MDTFTYLILRSNLGRLELYDNRSLSGFAITDAEERLVFARDSTIQELKLQNFSNLIDSSLAGTLER